MNLDGWTVLAQIVNFLLLVWLLKRFLYEPVRKVIEDREARLLRQREEAKQQAEAARAEEQRYKELSVALEAERRRILDEAVREADRERRRLIEEAQREAAAAKEEMLQRLREEKARLEAEIHRSIVGEACVVAGKVLQELTGVAVAEALIDAVGQKLMPLPPPAPLEGVEEGALEIRTSFEPTEDQESRLRFIVEQWTGRTSLEIAFVHDPSLQLGVEIAWGGEIVSWSARDLLQSVAAEALASIDANGAAGAAPGPASGEAVGGLDVPEGSRRGRAEGGAGGDPDAGLPGAVGHA